MYSRMIATFLLFTFPSIGESNPFGGDLEVGQYDEYERPLANIFHRETCGALVTNAQLGDNGVIESPNYPDPYPTTSDCEWLIQSMNATRIHVTFFDIRITSPRTPFEEARDYLDISLSGSGWDTQRYVGDLNSLTPFTLVSEANRIYVHFNSSQNSEKAPGFRLAYFVKKATSFTDEFNEGIPACKYSPMDKELTEQRDELLYNHEGADDYYDEEIRTEVELRKVYLQQLEKEFQELESINRTNENPYLVALLLDNQEFCAGTLIRNDYVLTTAYCVDGVEEIEMIFGAEDIYLQDAGVQRRTVNSSTIYIHPYYDQKTGRNDISLIELVEPVEITSFVKPARLPTWSSLGVAFTGVPTRISGWGSTERDEDSISTITNSVTNSMNLFISPNSACRSSQFFKGINGFTLCSLLKTNVKESCRVDLGSPVVLGCPDSGKTRKKKRPQKPPQQRPPSSNLPSGNPNNPFSPPVAPGLSPPGSPNGNLPGGSLNNNNPLQPPSGLQPQQPSLPGQSQQIIPGVSSCYAQLNSLFTRIPKRKPNPGNNYRPPGKRPSKPNKPQKPIKPGSAGSGRPQQKPNKPKPQRPPSRPSKPSKPQRPPNRPQKPSKPTKPKPQRPSKPNRPQKPSRPSKPQHPSKPNRPQKPSRPSKPQRPPRPPGGNYNNGCDGYSRSSHVLLGFVSYGTCTEGFAFTRATGYLDFFSDLMGPWYEEDVEEEGVTNEIPM